MAQYDARLESEQRVSGWAIGGVTFAGTMMILIGIFQVLNGIVAIANDDFFVVTRNYTFDLDVTAWGWFHLLLGILVVLSGFYLLAGRAWAGVVAITLAVLSAVLSFFFIPYYPWWSLLEIGLAVWVIWAITRPGVIRTE
jgi:hypothetical protein